MTAHDRIRLTGPFAEYSESRRLFQAFETQNDSPGREPSPSGADHFCRFSKYMTQPARIKPPPQQAAMMFGEISRSVFAARTSVCVSGSSHGSAIQSGGAPFMVQLPFRFFEETSK
jgi:hypothetical protein